MQVITKEFLNSAHVDKEVVDGIILVKSVEKAMTKRGDPYWYGELYSGQGVQFKVWSNSIAANNIEEMAGKVCHVIGVWSLYENTFSITITSIREEEGYSADDFIPTKYDVDKYWDALIAVTDSVLSAKGKALRDSIFDEWLVDRFKVEFAAKSHHDNCKGGLLAHTYKVCNAMRFILSMYPELVGGNKDTKDLYMLGAMIHDIGKVREMNFGEYQPLSYVTHRFLGIEMIDKERIIKDYGEDFYYKLVSVIIQHHDEYGDDARTLVAYVVYKVDLLDAEFTDMVQELAKNDERIRARGKYLVL